jgi:hypothetical protein
MGKKIALNVFYNLLLILSIIGMGWAYQNSSPLIIVFFAATFFTVLFFKIQLVKDFKKDAKK